LILFNEEFHFDFPIDLITVSSLKKSRASFSIFSLELTPSLKFISKKLLSILALFIEISLFKDVGSNNLC